MLELSIDIIAINWYGICKFVPSEQMPYLPVRPTSTDCESDMSTTKTPRNRSAIKEWFTKNAEAKRRKRIIGGYNVEADMDFDRLDDYLYAVQEFQGTLTRKEWIVIRERSNYLHNVERNKAAAATKTWLVRLDAPSSAADRDGDLLTARS